MSASATPSHSAPGLHIPTTDHNMEDIPQDYDNDFDIDLEGDIPHDDEGDIMTDHAHLAGSLDLDEITYDDEDMFDNDLEGTDHTVQENQDMYDNDLEAAGHTVLEHQESATVPDEHLTDATPIQTVVDDDDFDCDLDDESPAEQAAAGQAPQRTGVESAHSPGTLASPSIVIPAHNSSAPYSHVSPAQFEQLASPPHAAISNTAPATEAPVLEAPLSNVVALSPQEGKDSISQSAPGTTGEDYVGLDQGPIAEQSNSHDTAQDGPEDAAHSFTKNDADIDPAHSLPLHPVIVNYQGNHVSLFPDASDTFFLQDASLAYRPIYDMLQACADVLGDTIGDEDELVLDIPELGLCISEDHTFAPLVNLAQILHMYVALYRQDGVFEPDPLYVDLFTKTRFSARFTRLNHDAIDGLGVSQLAYLPTEEGSEYLNEVNNNEYSEHDQEQQVFTEEGRRDYGNEGNADYHHQQHSQPTNDESHATTVDLDSKLPAQDGTDDNTVAQVDVGVNDEPVNCGSEQEVARPASPVSAAEEDDLIDYSDDEDEAGETQPATGSGSGPSPVSSTVQADSTHSPSANTDIQNKSSHIEIGADGFDELDELDFGDEDADAAILNAANVPPISPSEPPAAGQEHEDPNEKLEREIEEELEHKYGSLNPEETQGGSQTFLEQPSELEGGQLNEDSQHEDPKEPEFELDFGEALDENATAKLENGQNAVSQPGHGSQTSAQDSLEVPVTATPVEHGGNGEDHNEIDYDDDLNYPVFADAAVDKKVESSASLATPSSVAVEEDVIDWESDDETTTKAVTTVNPGKRGLDEQEVGQPETLKKTRLD